MSNLSGHGQLTGVMRTGGGGGGGSEVIINPSGAAIGTMEKISVDGDIYEVRNVPDASSASNGDVLTRTASGVGWYPPTKELPVFTSSDNNKVLKINDGTLTWETIPKELPTITASDEGKVLGVSNGVPTWTNAGGGGSSINYSTNEVEIGTWIDRRKIYKKTWVFSEGVSINSRSWADTPISTSESGIYTIISCEGISDAGAIWDFLGATTDNATTEYIRLLNVRSDAGIVIKYLTLCYIKAGE